VDQQSRDKGKILSSVPLFITGLADGDATFTISIYKSKKSKTG
jgi:hypothetical protein